jgi:hypothetical protein
MATALQNLWARRLHKMAVDDLMNTLDPELLPCRECSSPCRVEKFGPSKYIDGMMNLWVCSNHNRFGGNCPSDIAYFTPEAWNDAQEPVADDDALRERVRDFIYDCTKDEFNTGWTLSAHQTDDLIAIIQTPAPKE